MKKRIVIFCRIVSICILFALLTTCMVGCRNDADSGGMAGEPIKDIADADMNNTSETKEYYTEKQISLESAIDAAFTLDTLVLLNEKDVGLEVNFLSKRDGSVLNSIEISDGRYSVGLRAGSDGAYLAYFVDDMSECKVVYLSKDGNKIEIEGFDFGNQEYTGDIFLKDVISDNGSDWLWFTTAVLASESGIEAFKDYDDGLYVVNRFFEVQDGKLQDGYIQEHEEIRASGFKYSKPAFIECGNVWNIETINKEKRAMDKYTLSELYFLSSWTGTYDVEAKLYEDNLYYIRDGAINCYSISKKTETKILDLFSCGINPDNVRYYDAVGEEFEIVTDNNYFKLTMGESDKQILVLACCGLSNTVDTSLQKAVAAFNSSSDKYIIKIKDYMVDDYDWNEAATALNLDIISGNIPDIIDIWTELDASVYASKGLLCNLYDFIDNDQTLSRDNFVPAILRAYGNEKALYTISSCFYIDTLISSKSRVGNKSGLSFEEFRNTLAATGSNAGAIEGLGTTDEEILTLLSTVLMDDLVDWEKGKCFFESKEFIDLLKFCKEYEDYRIWTEESLSNKVAQGKILASREFINNVSAFQIMKQIYGDDIIALGYPTDDGSGNVIKFTGSNLSITKNCADKQAAWEFVKDYISHPEYCEYQSFPVLADLLNEYLESSRTCRTEIDYETGEPYKYPNAEYYDYDVIYYAYEAEDSDIQGVYNIIENASRKEEYHTNILAIIEEEASAYLCGEKTADEVARVIQSRVQLMLNE